MKLLPSPDTEIDPAICQQKEQIVADLSCIPLPLSSPEGDLIYSWSHEFCVNEQSYHGWRGCVVCVWEEGTAALPTHIVVSPAIPDFPGTGKVC